MKRRVFSASRRFWLRRRMLGLVRTLLAMTAVMVSLGVTAALLGAMALNLDYRSGVQIQAGSGGNVTDRFQTFVTNSLSDALDGVLAIEKVYWLSDQDLVSPEPEESAYGESSDPAVLEELIRQAEPLLKGQSLYFDPNRERMPGTSVRYYLDETIFALAWKEIHDGCVYTYSEVKIGHPSQIRRMLSGGTYGSGQQLLTTEMSASVNAVVATSGDFYAHRRYGAVIWQSQLHRGYNGQLDLCLVDDRGDLLVLRSWEVPGEAELQQYILDNHIRFSLAFGPVIVEEGRQVYTGNYPVGENEDHFSRAAICQMEELHYLIAAANMEYGYPMVPTLNEFAWQMAATGCRTAYTLDGGQTAAIAMQDTLVNQVSYGSQRRISDILYFATAVPDGG